MRDHTLLLTDKTVDGLSFADSGQYKVHDSELNGFLVLVGKRRKTFMAQGDFWRNGVREFSARKKIDESENISTREARNRAKGILAGIAKGIRPGETPRANSGEITLRQAWERYRDAHMVRRGGARRRSRVIDTTWTGYSRTGSTSRSLVLAASRNSLLSGTKK